MITRKIRCLVFAIVSVASMSSALAADKHALLVAVTNYSHQRMNEAPLRFPEADAQSIGERLRQSGYEVTLLLGKQASKEQITNAMQRVATAGSADGVLLLGFFGHGVQYDSNAYYCPYDTNVTPVKDSDGKTLRDRNGQLLLEPAADSLVPMLDMLDALSLSGAGNKLLIADCCREDPNRARGLRGRAFGSSLRVDQLPRNCAALFACSEGERAFEHDEWRHGAFTKAFLDECQASDDVTANMLSVNLYRRVNGLVKEKTAGADKQSVSSVLSGVIDLKLQMDSQVSIPMKPEPFPPAKPPTKGAEPTTGFYVNGVGAKMILIPAGTFMMGAPEDDPAMSDRDKPQHQVTISKPFYMGETELTQGQWKAVMGTEPWKEAYVEEVVFPGADTTQERVEPSRFEGANYPVVHVTWNDAVEYCRRLSEREGRTYRLPTGAEWEYACRAGTTTLHSFGDEVSNVSQYAWSKYLTEVSNESYAHLVKQKLPNAFSLYDMHGNVAELCSDGWTPYKPEPVVDPFNAIEFDYRAKRGGSWATYQLRSDARGAVLPSEKSNDLGFRIVSVEK